MINYNRSAFGLNLLFRVHGSAIYRSVVPGLVAVGLFLCLRLLVNDGSPGDEVGHPYAVGVVVGGTTFLIVFRASQGYSRYWEACGSVYHMMSKWMDATIHTACYHMQCDHYDSIKPPSFYDYHHLNSKFLTRDRERIRPSSSSSNDDHHHHHHGFMNIKRAQARSINAVGVQQQEQGATNTNTASKHSWRTSSSNSSGSGSGSGSGTTTSSRRTRFRARPTMINKQLHYQSSKHFQTANEDEDDNDNDSGSIRTIRIQNTIPKFLTGPPRPDGNWSNLFPDQKGTFCAKASSSSSASSSPTTTTTTHDPKHGFASHIGGHTPPLFLQEMAHLTSLLVAVALSTLRNDVDGTESPLDYYSIGDPWPEVDPQNIPDLYASGMHKLFAAFGYFLGMGRSPEERTRYNACRPLGVIGGVSDSEIQFLQLARGPYAKTQLCWNWLSEFVIREHLAGSLGPVGPPIISRIVQFLGDGMTYYNHARKIMFVPFPFPHAQLSAAFVSVMVLILPFLMDQYCTDIWFGACLTYLGVVCLTGINEVGRELENPFRNVPNELPLVTLMAEFNEALITMYAGYHPDFYWQVPSPSSSSSSSSSEGRPKDRMPKSATTTTTPTPFSGGSNSAASSSSGTSSHLNTTDENQHMASLTEETMEDLLDDSAEAHPQENKKEPVMSQNKKTKAEDYASDDQTNQQFVLQDQVEQLRAIVIQQGELMGNMLQEQTRLNQMMQTALLTKTRIEES